MKILIYKEYVHKIVDKNLIYVLYLCTFLNNENFYRFLLKYLSEQFI